MSVRLEVDGPVSTIWLDRAHKRNALDATMLDEILDATSVVADHTEIRVLVVRGAEGWFSAGADIGDWADPGPSGADRLSRLGTTALDSLAALRIPTVAAIEGGAVGGGLELALACDVRIATHGAHLGFPEARLGNLTAWGGIARIVDAVGLPHTRALFMTGTLISGRRAHEIGLVHQSVDPDDFDAGLTALIGDLLQAEPLAVAVLKDVLSAMESNVRTEPVLAAFFSRSEASRDRKQAFLDRKKSKETT